MESSPAQDNLTNRDYYTAMAHLYRGELGRIMMWRQRLDATTNWAILATTGVISFALGSTVISHIVFMLANLMVFLLMVIEGRRYRYYDAYRARVRILEAHFYAPIILRDDKYLQGEWRKLLAEDMLISSFKMSLSQAVGKRLNQNYCWIFLIILAALCMKILLHFPRVETIHEFFLALHKSQPLHPVLYWIIFLIFYGALIVLSIEGKKSNGLHDEFSRPSPKPDLWKI